MKPDREGSWRRLALLNRCLLAAFPLFLTAAALDLTAWSGRSRAVLPPIQPDLQRLEEPQRHIPSLSFLPEMFHPGSGRRPESESATPVAVRQAEWKLKGVLLGTVKKALLENGEGWSVWVTEGESLGDSGIRVQAIAERSVLLEEGGKGYEIRM